MNLNPYPSTAERGLLRALDQRQIERTHLGVPDVADDNAKLSGIGQDADPAGITDAIFEGLLIGRLIELRKEGTVIHLKYVFRAVQLEKDRFDRTAPFAVLAVRICSCESRDSSVRTCKPIPVAGSWLAANWAMSA